MLAFANKNLVPSPTSPRFHLYANRNWTKHSPCESRRFQNCSQGPRLTGTGLLHLFLPESDFLLLPRKEAKQRNGILILLPLFA